MRPPGVTIFALSPKGGAGRGFPTTAEGSLSIVVVDSQPGPVLIKPSWDLIVMRAGGGDDGISSIWMCRLVVLWELQLNGNQ